MALLRIVVFAEGSSYTSPSGKDWFVTLWTRTLVEVFGLCEVQRVVPINKKHILAMDPASPKMSGSAEGLDALMERVQQQQPFDVAVIAWDLYPEWPGVSESACRWGETLRLFALLGASTRLSSPWRDAAAARHRELKARPVPSARSYPPKLSKYQVYALCMEPEFEALVMVSEDGVRRVLGVAGEQVKGWPVWPSGGEVGRISDVLATAIDVARRLRKKEVPFRFLRGDMESAKHEWGEYLLRELAKDREAAPLLHAHPTAARLRELLPPPREAPRAAGG